MGKTVKDNNIEEFVKNGGKVKLTFEVNYNINPSKLLGFIFTSLKSNEDYLVTAASIDYDENRFDYELVKYKDFINSRAKCDNLVKLKINKENLFASYIPTGIIKPYADKFKSL